MSNIDYNKCMGCGADLKDKKKHPVYTPIFSVVGYRCERCNEKSKEDLKDRLFENADTIALFSAAIIAVFLVYAGILPKTDVNIIILIILALLAFHHLRRTLKIEKMHKQIEEIYTEFKMFSKKTKQTKLFDKMGIENITSKREEIPNDEMNDVVSNGVDFFVLCRYFQAFEKQKVREVTHNCLKNGGSVKIIIYAPEGNHLKVEIESDVNANEAKNKIFETLRRLKNFKQELQQELQQDAQKRFQYKILENYVIYVSLVGTANKIYATTYLNNLRGDECPTIVCKALDGSNDLYSIYLGEFNRMWKVARYDNNNIETV